MPIVVRLPSLSPTMEEANLVKWRVAVGDIVRPGDVLAEVETDKAVLDLEAIDEGVVDRLLFSEGAEGIPVNAEIAILRADGEVASTTPPKTSNEDGAGEAAPKSSGYDAVLPEDGGTAAPANEVPVPEGDREADVSGAAVSNGEMKIRATPLARRLARQFKVDLNLISGSGPRGRITRADVERAAADGTARLGMRRPLAGTHATPLSAFIDLYGADTYDLTPLNSMRRTIARRLTEASRDIPHFPITVDCELDLLIEQRARLNRELEAKGEGKISLNDFVIRAAAHALKKVPEVNTTYTDEGLLKHKHADIAVAVAMRDGLITPILRKAETKGLLEISSEMKDLAARAREKRLRPEEYQGGTFSISNMGMFGLKTFVSIINPPHGAILSVGAIGERAMSKGGKLYSAQVMSVTLVCDHRAIDGLPSAEWIDVFKSALENPLSVLL